MKPCNEGGTKHHYEVQASPWSFLVFKCSWCEKFYYIPKFIYYEQMMKLGTWITHHGKLEKPQKRWKWWRRGI